jgi:hypothetical protein
MSSETALAEALGVSYAAGLNVPATVAILGIAEREGWIATLPAGLEVVGSSWIIALAVTTHGAKLGLRFAVDASPEPVTNAIANFAELATIASVAISIWRHPYLTLSLALLLLVLLILLVRRVLRAVRRVFSGGWTTASQA